VYLPLANSHNINSIADGKRIPFADDCGAWTKLSSSMSRTTLVTDSRGSWRPAYINYNGHCIERNGARTPIEHHSRQQEASSFCDTITANLQRSQTTTNVASHTAERRIGNSDGLSLVLFSGHKPHGNVTVTASDSRYTTPDTLDAIDSQTGFRPAKQVFHMLDADGSV
jgi:hypothetical protein